MKQIVLLLALLSLAACYRQRPLPYKSTEPVLVLTGDSGYIKKADAYKFLLANQLTDRSDYWNTGVTDKAAKYYRLKKDGNYYACFSTQQEKYSHATNTVVELSPTGVLLNYGRFMVGNYPCCWNTPYDGFGRYQNYLGVKKCGTGSGYCSTNLYLFTEVNQLDSVNGIPIAYWSSSVGAESLDSEIEMANNSATIHYTLENGELTDSLEFIVKHTRKFDVHYTFENNQWETTEKDKYQGLDIVW